MNRPEHLDGAQAPRSALLDRKAIASDYGLRRVDVDRVFRTLPVVALPGSRKVYVRRADLEQLLAECTYDGGRVRPT